MSKHEEFLRQSLELSERDWRFLKIESNGRQGSGIRDQGSGIRDQAKFLSLIIPN
jgi:hypothetical protein